VDVAEASTPRPRFVHAERGWVSRLTESRGAPFGSSVEPAGADRGLRRSSNSARLRSAAVDDRDAILRSLLDERTVDIVTTGRRSNAARTTEIWTTVVDGQTYICGTPNASQPGVERRPLAGQPGGNP
jgi:hypothetical protein